MTPQPNWVPGENVATLSELFCERVRLTPNAIAYCDRVPASSDWQQLTWSDMADKVARWRAGLATQKLQPGARVAILMPNSSEWIAIDQAVHSLGLVVVGLFPDDTAQTNAALLEKSGASVLVVEQTAAWQAINSTQPLPELDLVITREAIQQPVSARVRSVTDWLPRQGGVTAPHVAPESLAALVYTSGTSGQARGAMLSHANLLWNAYACASAVKLPEQEVLLSFLPLAHGFERVVGYYRTMITGGTTYFCRQKRLLHKDMAQVQPTALVGVPEIYERYHRELFRRLGHQSAFTRRLVRFTINLGWSVFQHQQGLERKHLRHILWPLLRATVAKRCLRALGGRLDTAVSGAAALSPPVARTFIGLGINLLQGYGLTEAGPVVSVNRRENNDPQSVGLLLDGAEIRIGADNELMLRSPGVMQGYWRDEAATAKAIDSTGWLHTGDKVSRLEQQRLYLTGRVKEVIVMTTGEKASPEPIEQLLQSDPLVGRVVVVGDARPYLAAIINCSQDALNKELLALGLSSKTVEQRHNSRVERALLKRFSARLRDYPKHSQIRRIAITTEDWSVDNKLLTATGKARRRQVARHYHQTVERLYGRGPAPQKTDFSYNVNVG